MPAEPAARRPRTARGSGRTSPPAARRSARSTARPGSVSSAGGAFCSANITWNSGGWLEVALRRQLLDQLLERQVLVGVGRQRRLAAPARAAPRSSASPGRSVRSTRVLTKKPISPSISARLRLATGVPTDEVRLPAVARWSSAWKAASRVMNRVTPCARGRARCSAGAELAPGSATGSRCAARRSAPAGAAGRSAARGPAARRRAARASRRAALRAPLREPAPLPDGEVGVLERQLGQRRRPARRRRPA